MSAETAAQRLSRALEARLSESAGEGGGGGGGGAVERFQIIDEQRKSPKRSTESDDDLDDTAAAAALSHSARLDSSDLQPPHQLAAPPNTPVPSLTPASSVGYNNLLSDALLDSYQPTISTQPFGQQKVDKTKRFAVVQVDARYTRGRWRCYDFAGDVQPDDAQSKPRDPMIPLDQNRGRGGSGSSSKASSVRLEGKAAEEVAVNKPKLSVAQPPPPPPVEAKAPRTPAASPADSPSIPDKPLLAPQASSVETAAATEAVVAGPPPSAVGSWLPLTVNTPPPPTYQSSYLDSAPGEMAGSALNTSWKLIERMAADDAERHYLHSLVLPGASAPATSPSANAYDSATDSPLLLRANGSTPANALVAIDAKIEQAMDLVKTHLMYAVRAEVDVLRHKISDLEHKVNRLEKENALLRENVPADVLSRLPAMLAAAAVPPLSQQASVPIQNAVNGDISEGKL